MYICAIEPNSSSDKGVKNVERAPGLGCTNRTKKQMFTNVEFDFFTRNLPPSCVPRILAETRIEMLDRQIEHPSRARVDSRERIFTIREKAHRCVLCSRGVPAD